MNQCEFFKKYEYVCDAESESSPKICTKEYSKICQWANEKRKILNWKNIKNESIQQK